MTRNVRAIAEFLGWLWIALAVISAADRIDFHICISGPGECPSMRPTTPPGEAKKAPNDTTQPTAAETTP